MRILVTGGTGFSGSALTRRLIGMGHSVVALDYQPGLDAEGLRKAGADVIIGSVTNRADVAAASRGVELVFHLAAAFRDLKASDDKYKQVNANGTKIVVEEAISAGARKIVYCSTCGVHGNVENPPADEDAPIAPADYYQRTKYDGEVVLERFRDKIEYTILRPAAIYGPGDPERFFMIFKKVNGGKFPMFGGGMTTYHPLYIENLVDAFVAVMPEGAGRYTPYLIADKEFVTLNDLVTRVGQALEIDVQISHYPVTPLVVAGHVCEKVCKPLGVSPPIFPRRVDWYRQNRAFDIGRAERELGYDGTKVQLDEGLRNTADWYREKGYL